jgi:prephenate dehydrogenase
LARVSHLPHVLAALVVAIQGKRSVSLAGYAFLDITRIALGDPVLWREIIMTNRPAILSSIDAADEQLMVFRDLVELSDGPGIEKYLAEAKARRDAL